MPATVVQQSFGYNWRCTTTDTAINTPLYVATDGMTSNNSTSFATNGFIFATNVECDFSLPAPSRTQFIENCIINVPLQVATNGFSENNSMSVASNGFQFCQLFELDGANDGVWFVRENKDDPLQGPYNYPQAEANARALSKDENKSGLSELVTFLGTRFGDPSVVPSQLFVVYMYIRGKKTLGGRTAEYHSDNSLPPTV